jgi:hypothetical protein
MERTHPCVRAASILLALSLSTTLQAGCLRTARMDAGAPMAGAPMAGRSGGGRSDGGRYGGERSGGERSN